MTTATSRPCMRIVDSSSGAMFEVWAFHELSRLQGHSASLSFLARNPRLRPLADTIIEVRTESGAPRLLVAAAMASDGAGRSSVSWPHQLQSTAVSEAIESHESRCSRSSRAAPFGRIVFRERGPLRGAA